jgi:hypothetical protein
VHKYGASYRGSHVCTQLGKEYRELYTCTNVLPRVSSWRTDGAPRLYSKWSHLYKPSVRHAHPGAPEVTVEWPIGLGGGSGTVVIGRRFGATFVLMKNTLICENWPCIFGSVPAGNRTNILWYVHQTFNWVMHLVEIASVARLDTFRRNVQKRLRTPIRGNNTTVM